MARQMRSTGMFRIGLPRINEILVGGLRLLGLAILTLLVLPHPARAQEERELTTPTMTISARALVVSVRPRVSSGIHQGMSSTHRMIR